MKKIIFLLMFSLFFISNIDAQEKLKGSKNVITQHREIGFFDAILVKDDIKVFITESPVNKVSVETDDNLQIAVETRIADNTLEVYLSNPISRKKELNIYIGVTDSIHRIEARDHATIIGENEMHTNNIEVFAHDNATIKMSFRTANFSATAQGRSDLNCSVSATNAINVNLEQNASFKSQASCNIFTASLSDSANLKPTGNCQEIVIISNDNGSFRGKDMLTDYASIQVTDRADVFINASKELIINSENNATIHVFNNPKIFIEKFVDKSSLHKK